MSERAGYSEEGDLVVLRMTRDDFFALLIALGRATGAAIERRGPIPFESWVEIANRLNEGNPGWTPYRLSDVQRLAEHFGLIER